nr:DUF1737 domain-containing protein [uncultured Flavobacterium sp.]
MKYIVLTGDHTTQLEEEVNKHIASGWILQGGVSISRSRSKSKGGADDLVYAQAMIKVNP